MSIPKCGISVGMELVSKIGVCWEGKEIFAGKERLYYLGRRNYICCEGKALFAGKERRYLLRKNGVICREEVSQFSGKKRLNLLGKNSIDKELFSSSQSWSHSRPPVTQSNRDHNDATDHALVTSLRRTRDVVTSLWRRHYRILISYRIPFIREYNIIYRNTIA